MEVKLTLSDWLSIVGTAISLLGFTITIFQLKKTKNAADAAQVASNEAKNTMQQLDTIVSMQKINGQFDELKTVLRHNNLAVAIIYITDLRKSIASLKGAHSNDASYFQKHLNILTTIHSKIENIDIKTDPEIIRDIILQISDIQDSICERSSNNISTFQQEKENKNVRI